MDNEQIDREILEAIKALTTGRGIPSSEQILSRTSVGHTAQWKDQLWRIRLLGDKRMVKVLGDLGDDLAVSLDSLGEQRLSMSEEEYQRRNQRPSTHTTRIDINNSPIGNLANVIGSQGVSINQTNISNDLQQLNLAIDRLMHAVKSSPSLETDVKQDAQIEADQLKGELQKTKPNPSRISQALEWFKALDSAATVLPHVLDVVNKLKGYLPGNF